MVAASIIGFGPDEIITSKDASERGLWAVFIKGYYTAG
jgi:hypothetical protein